MGVLLWIAAERREFDGFLKHSGRGTRLAWPIRFAQDVKWGGKRVIVAAHGAGRKLAGEAIRTALSRIEEEVEGILSTGFCGALETSLKAGDIVAATEVNGIPAEIPGGRRARVEGPVLSQDRVAVTAGEKARLRGQGAVAVEMEAAAVAEEAVGRGIRFSCVRAVTDAASDNLPLDFNRYRGPDGDFRRAAIAAAAFRHPFERIPALMELDRVTRSASRALGDFLADCRF